MAHIYNPIQLDTTQIESAMTNRLKELRLSNEMTQQNLADSVNVSRQTIISIESGRYIPSVSLSLKIAKVLVKKVEDIFKLEKTD